MENSPSLMLSKTARWTTLILVSITMLTSYFFMDMLAPLQSTLETDYQWSPSVYGGFSGAMYLINVFLFFIIISGIILDKKGIRFTGITATLIMLIGGVIKYYGLTDYFNLGGLGYGFLNSFWTSVPASAKLASTGFAIFGTGLLMYAITSSKAIVKWFRGKELALAIGIQLATARIGVMMAFSLSAPIAGEPPVVLRTVTFGVILLCIGFLTFFAYTFLDRKADHDHKDTRENKNARKFHVSDIKIILTNKTFIFTSIFIALFYSAVYPFLKYAINMMQYKLQISAGTGGLILGLLPIGAIILTPMFGFFLDKYGKGINYMLIGVALLTLAHLTFALVPLSMVIAIVAIIVLGVAFSMVPATLWQSIPKIVEDRYLGTSYAFIFWIQNVGLWAIPLLIGIVLEAVNPGVSEKIKAGDLLAGYDYTIPMIIFASLGIVAVIFGLLIGKEDKRRGYGLNLPNKQ